MNVVVDARDWHPEESQERKSKTFLPSIRADVHQLVLQVKEHERRIRVLF